jgi:hypothetical protein
VSFFQSSIHNLQNAVEARVFRRKVGDDWNYIDATPHEPGVYHSQEFEDAFDEHVELVAPMTEQEFVQHYRGRKRKVYDQAVKSLSHVPLKIEDADCKAFLKKEKDIASDKPDAVPRVITFPDPRFGLCFGRFVKKIEHPFFDAIDRVFGSKTVMKGLNYEEVGKEISRKWNLFTDPASIDGDVSRLDSSISDEAQRLYHRFVQKFYAPGDKEEFAELCEMQLGVDVRGRAQNGSVQFKSSGLGSGQMNTSQMGVFIVCFILYCLFREYDLELELVNCGDDFTVIGERQTVLRFQGISKQWFSKFNMVLKMEPLNEIIEGIEFCQTHPVLFREGYRMVRNPLNALTKDAVSIDHLKTTTRRCAYLHAISCSGIATHGGVPIFQDVYRMFSKSAARLRSDIKSKRGLKRSYNYRLDDNSMLYWGKGLNCSYSHISSDTRFSFYLAYDIDPVTQMQIEAHYRTLEISDCIQTHTYGDAYLGVI